MKSLSIEGSEVFKKILFIFLVSIMGLYAKNITVSVKSGAWYLVGSAGDVDISSLNISSDDVLWSYKNGTWVTNQSYEGIANLTSLQAGDAFWMLSKTDKTLTLPVTTSSEYTFHNGWYMYSPNQDLTVDKSLNDSNISIVWRYKNGTWFAWDRDGKYAKYNIPKVETLRVGEGAWVLANGDFTTSLLQHPVIVGSKRTTLKDGSFTKVLKSSTQSVEDIWNISFEIDTKNVSNFKIGIKFIKKSSGAFGEMVYSGLSINNGKLSGPTAIDISGTKSDGTSGGTYFDDSYDPHGLRAKSISLVGNRLTLKLGTIMANQTLISPNTFKSVSDYNITIVPTEINIVGGVTKTLSNLAYLGEVYSGEGIVGDIEIH